MPSNRVSSNNPASLFTMASDLLASQDHSPTAWARLCLPRADLCPTAPRTLFTFPATWRRRTVFPAHLQVLLQRALRLHKVRICRRKVLLLSALVLRSNEVRMGYLSSPRLWRTLHHTRRTLLARLSP